MEKSKNVEKIRKKWNYFESLRILKNWKNYMNFEMLEKSLRHFKALSLNLLDLRQTTKTNQKYTSENRNQSPSTNQGSNVKFVCTRFHIPCSIGSNVTGTRAQALKFFWLRRW